MWSGSTPRLLNASLSPGLPSLPGPTVGGLLWSLAAGDAEGALLTDADGRDQPLVAAYRAPALRRELAALARERAAREGRSRGARPARDPAGPDRQVKGRGSRGAAPPSASRPKKSVIFAEAWGLPGCTAPVRRGEGVVTKGT